MEKLTVFLELSRAFSALITLDELLPGWRGIGSRELVR
jgi:hypothetical protein